MLSDSQKMPVKIPAALLHPNLESVPEELKEWPQWVVWKAVERRREDGTIKITKVPHNPKTGKRASTDRPKDWGSFDDVFEAFCLGGGYDGIGFVFTAEDPFVGIDLDNCYDQCGNLRDDARQAIGEIQSFTEKSPSGKGLHIICKGELLGRGHCDNNAGREMYQEGRFFTITAEVVEGYGTVKEASPALGKLYQNWFGKSASNDLNYTIGDFEWNREAPLIPLDDMPIGEHWKVLVRDGDADSVGRIDRSAVLYSVSREMLNAGVNVESILTTLTDREYYLAGAALERRRNRKSAQEWLWKYTLGPALAERKGIVEMFDDLPPLEVTEPAPKKNRKYGIEFIPASNLIHDVGRITWLIKDYVETETLVVAFGEPGVGKSFMAADLACRVATGMPWRGLPVKQGTVFYINGEGQEGFSRRIRGWYLRYKVDPARLMVGKRAIPLTDNAAVLELVEVIKEMAGQYGSPVLVVIDTLARNFGGKDENSTMDMGFFVDHIERHIMQVFGCVALVIHHPGLSDKSRYRGASNLKGAVDVEYRLISDPGGVTRLHNQKVKDGPEPPDVRFRLESQSLQNGSDDTTAVVVWEDDFEGETSDSVEQNLTDQQRTVWKVLNSMISDSECGKLKNKSLVQACKEKRINASRVSEARDRLEELGRITTEKTGREILIQLNNDL